MAGNFLCIVFTIGFVYAAPPTNIRFSLVDPHIVGGSNATGKLPYQISLRVSESGNANPSALRHYCGGTLIQPDIVLTAAHCLAPNHLENLRRGLIYVVAGTNLLQFKPPTTFVTPVVAAIKHHQHAHKRGHANDVAILKLLQPAPIDGTNIGLIPMRTSPTSAETKCIISGWGTTQYGNPTAAAYLQTAVVPIVHTSQCEKKYGLLGYRITSDMICAGLNTGGVDSCQGDSGGPLVCDSELTGVVSWGYRCAMPSVPGIYASVAYHKEWIDESIAKIRTLATDTPPTSQKPNNAATKSVSLALVLSSVLISSQMKVASVRLT